MGTLNILECARKHNIQVVYSGSSTKHKGVFKSPYAWSKYGGEQLCELYSKIYDLNTTICRFYNVYGDYHIRTGDYATVVGIFEEQFKYLAQLSEILANDEGIEKDTVGEFDLGIFKILINSTRTYEEELIKCER